VKHPDDNDRAESERRCNDVDDAMRRQPKRLRKCCDGNEQSERTLKAKTKSPHVAAHATLVSREYFVTQHCKMTADFAPQIEQIILKSRKEQTSNENGLYVGQAWRTSQLDVKGARPQTRCPS